MSVVRDVYIKITGQVPDDFDDNNYNLVVAKLRVICAEHQLELEEIDI
jgi:hypothetical protein